MIRTVVVKYKGLELICRGFHSRYKEKGPDELPEHECFEIDTIHYNNADVTELLTQLNFDWSELECLCLDSLKD